MRTAPKEDLGCCSEECVYGSTIIISGDFIGNLTVGPHMAQLLPSLRDKMQGLKPVLASHHGATKESDLAKATYVFIQQDTHCLPLQQPYNGLYRDLIPRNKTFTREETISINRLKLVHMDQDVLVHVAIPPWRGQPPIPRAVHKTEMDQASVVAKQVPPASPRNVPAGLLAQVMQRVDPPMVTCTGRIKQWPAHFWYVPLILFLVGMGEGIVVA